MPLMHVMQVWSVHFQPDSFTEQLFQKGLSLVDIQSISRINRFYHRADACRCLIGRLLPRTFLKEHGVPRDAISIGKTEAGKPIVETEAIRNRMGFNVSHDNSLVVMAFQEASDEFDSDVTQIGIDIMKIALPRYNKSRDDFVTSISDTITPLERISLLDQSICEYDGLRRIFFLWTIKEAYAKALGRGLSFDFKRLEYNFTSGEVRLDGDVLRGWEFISFDVSIIEGDNYQGVVARNIGGTNASVISHRDISEGSWYRQFDTKEFMELAVKKN